jgi:hypothetical protein
MQSAYLLANCPYRMKHFSIALFASLLLLLGCGGAKPKSTPVTLAIPLKGMPEMGRVLDYHRILAQDSLLRNGRLEGLPEKRIDVRLEAMEMNLLHIRPSDVIKSLQSTYPAEIAWTVSKDSMELSFPSDALQAAANVDSFASTPIRSRESGSQHELFAFARVAETEKPRPLLINGKVCMALRGNTLLPKKELQSQLAGAEKYLGEGWFLIYGE